MLPNPFDLRGPEFLLFFTVFVLLLATGVAWLRRRREAGERHAGDLLQDPYEIACLRGGTRHLLQTALVALVNRGLLTVKGVKLKTADPSAVDKAQRPLDKAILTKFLWETEAVALFTEESILAQAEAVGERLREARLLPDAEQKGARGTLLLGALGLLFLVAGVKIVVALSRGHHNILFLLGLTFVSVIVLYKLVNPFRTAAGQRVMKRIQEMLSNLHARRRSLSVNSATNEITLLVAAFGMDALPTEMANQIKPLKLRQTSDSGDSSGWFAASSCDVSSCGSSSASGGGSSCGGGGGGSGCGGCGGGGCGGGG